MINDTIYRILPKLSCAFVQLVVIKQLLGNLNNRSVWSVVIHEFSQEVRIISFPGVSRVGVAGCHQAFEKWDLCKKVRIEKYHWMCMWWSISQSITRITVLGISTTPRLSTVCLSLSWVKKVNSLHFTFSVVRLFYWVAVRWRPVWARFTKSS